MNEIQNEIKTFERHIKDKYNKKIFINYTITEKHGNKKPFFMKSLHSEIRSLAASYFDVSNQQFIARNGKRAIIRGRQMAAHYLMDKFPMMSKTEICVILNYRHHEPLKHAVEMVDLECERNEIYRLEYQNFCRYMNHHISEMKELIRGN